MAEQLAVVPSVTLSVDGVSITVPKGTTVLEAAEAAGTRIPHYCYHAGLSSPAMCRLCLVEVEGAPKLQPSCVTQVQEGQVVRTQSEKALEMRRGVLEFYLVNHPLDCPICDQSGECKLQDYVHAEGRMHGRSREPKRVFGRDDFGGDVLFYGDRCVMCTRCVRFMNEVEQEPRLAVVERGDRAIIDTFFEEGLAGTNFHGNIVDICPVGALVSKDFLHKQRAWDLGHTPSVCPNCSQGCNIDLQTRDNAVQRLKPRENPEVNGHWMCDFGRLRYEWMNAPDRADRALRNEAGGPRAMPFHEAIEELTSALVGICGGGEGGRIVALASPRSSNEELGALAGLARALGDAELYFRGERAEDEIVLAGFPRLTRRQDLAPNVDGAALMGYERIGDDTGAGGLDVLSGARVLFVLGDALEDLRARPAEVELFVHLSSGAADTATGADFVLPLATFAEQEGTFTNHEGRVQRFLPALTPPGEARPGWRACSSLHAAVGGEAAPTSAADMFTRLAAEYPAFAGMTYPAIGMSGDLVNDAVEIGGAAR